MSNPSTAHKWSVEEANAVKQALNHLQSQNHQHTAVIKELQEQLAAIRSQPVLLPSTSNSALKPEKPSLFYGTANESIDNWLFELEVWFDAVNVSDEQHQARIRFTRAQLRGAASAFIKHLDDTQSDAAQIEALTWSQFKSILLERFRPVASSKLARYQLNNLKQHNSVEAYCQQFLHIISLIPNMTEEESIDRFVMGLKPHIRRDIGMWDPETLPRAMNLAQRADLQYIQHNNFRNSNQLFSNTQQRNFNRNNNNRQQSTMTYVPAYSQLNNTPNSSSFTTQPLQRQQNNNMPFRNNNSNPFQFTNSSSNSRVDTSIPMQIDRMQATLICYFCKKPGHIARHCPILKQRINMMAHAISAHDEDRESNATTNVRQLNYQAHELNSPHSTASTAYPKDSNNSVKRIQL